jgi:DNA topoisomerase-1
LAGQLLQGYGEKRLFSTDPIESAAEAGLTYVTGRGPCIRRLRHGKSFRYIGADNRPVRDPKHLARIRSLVIPPAWRDVWICPSPNGHLQAVGWDTKGRKQYRYHPRYRATRDQAKFSRMLAFGALLARIRQAVQRDLERRGLPKEKVVAVVVRLLETAFLRIGNDEYTKANESFGLTTLRNRHVSIDGTRLMFRFRGKSAQEQVVELTDRKLARIVKQCQDLPGYDLFEYQNGDGSISRIDSADVNRYIREVSGEDFTAKDFRTWAGTVLAVHELYAAGASNSSTQTKKNVIEAVKRVAKSLGNRPATCRKYYIHPAVTDAYMDSSLITTVEQGIQQDTAYAGLGLSPEEYAVMVIVAKYQENLAKGMRAKAA